MINCVPHKFDKSINYFPCFFIVTYSYLFCAVPSGVCEWTQVFITARIRRMGEGNSFTLLVCPQGMGVPPPIQGWMGVSPSSYVGTPRPEMGVSPAKVTTPPPRTCYTAGGMPLAFTQEDFLVFNWIEHACFVWKGFTRIHKCMYTYCFQVNCPCIVALILFFFHFSHMTTQEIHSVFRVNKSLSKLHGTHTGKNIHPSSIILDRFVQSQCHNLYSTEVMRCLFVLRT